MLPNSNAETVPVAAFGKDVLELREQCPARIREVLEGLAKESQDWVITIHAAPLEDLVQCTQLAWPQAEEVSVLPASPVEACVDAEWIALEDVAQPPGLHFHGLKLGLSVWEAPSKWLCDMNELFRGHSAGAQKQP